MDDAKKPKNENILTKAARAVGSVLGRTADKGKHGDSESKAAPPQATDQDPPRAAPGKKKGATKKLSNKNPSKASQKTAKNRKKSRRSR